MTIEECLKFLVNNIGVNTSDKNILESICRQNSKGSALTDRQCNLVKEKLLLFKEQFLQHNIDVEHHVAIGDLEQPLREIDRSKYIKICKEGEEIPLKGIDEHRQWIKVRFPFNKKTIQKINLISISHKDYHHSKGSHEHYYKFREINVIKVLDKLIDSNFEIDKELIEIYNKSKDIISNKEDYVPRFSNGELKNVTSNCKKLIKTQLGELDQVKLLDRKRMYGLEDVQANIPDNLAGRIAQRSQTYFLAKPSKYSLDQIAEACFLLNRFPILVLIDNNLELEQLSSFYNSIKYYVPSKKQTVLFRVDNTDKPNVNNFIHQNKLNNWLDESTEIVYIKKQKLPKLLLKSSWKPMCTISLSSDRPRKHVNLYMLNNDLVIFYDEELSILGQYNGVMQTYY